jgi:hypothetical protein
MTFFLSSMTNKTFIVIYCIWEYYGACLIRSSNYLPFASTRVHHWCLVGSVLLIFLVFCFVFLCFICLRPVSCVTNVDSVSGLFLLDYPFGLISLTRLLKLFLSDCCKIVSDRVFFIMELYIYFHFVFVIVYVCLLCTVVIVWFMRIKDDWLIEQKIC